jgi:hypothetical protein
VRDPNRTSRAAWLGAAVLGVLALAAAAHATATITINNLDGAGEGFSDPAARAAVGGNPATTLGGQRLFVFQTAAAEWGAILDSPVTIVVDATFDPLFCDGIGSVDLLTVVRREPPTAWAT